MNNNILSIFPNENFLDLRFYQFGWEQCRPLHSFGPAIRNHYLFHYVISGTGILMANNEKGETITYRLESGQGFMIFPNQVCTYTADEQQPWEYAWIEFDGLRAKEMVERAGFSVSTPVYQAREKVLRDTMRDELMYIVEHRNESPFHLIGHLYLLIDSLVRSSASAKDMKEHNLRDYYTREAMSFIEQNYQKAITVEDIAASCRLNRSYFGKIFHEYTGKSPQEFLISYRMMKATDFLKFTSMSIGEISCAVGYENQLHFSRAFKNVYGVSPRQWRNEHILK